MHRLREQIEIEAPVALVWKTVHRDIAKVASWSKNLVRTEVMSEGPVGAGSELRYVAKLPAGMTHALTLHIEEYDEPRRCSGRVEGPVMSGQWLWRYRMRGDVTVVTYETTVELRGMLRFAGPLVEQQVRADVRANLQALKEHVEKQQAKASSA